VTLFVVQMYYSSLKSVGGRVAAAVKAVHWVSGGEFILVRRDEHTSAIAFMSDESETRLSARFQRFRRLDFSVIVFDAAWILGRNMFKQLDDLQDRHDSTLHARTRMATDLGERPETLQTLPSASWRRPPASEVQRQGSSPP
jgi:hypothetical protein